MLAGNPAPESPDFRPHPRIGAGVKSTDLPGFLSLAGLCAEGIVEHLQVLLYPGNGREDRARLRPWQPLASRSSSMLPTTCTE
jgi:hypothetical protein